MNKLLLVVLTILGGLIFKTCEKPQSANITRRKKVVNNSLYSNSSPEDFRLYWQTR